MFEGSDRQRGAGEAGRLVGAPANRWEKSCACPPGPAPAGAPLVVAALLLIAPPVEAQETRVITFREAVATALDRNTEIRRARADLDVRGSVETRETMAFLPRISLSTRGRRSFGRSFSQEEGEILSETNDIFDAGVSVSLDLFDGMAKVASVQQASLQEEASSHRLGRARENVLFRVVQGFGTLIQDQELARVREEEVAAARELLEQIRQLVETGRAPVSDLYQQQAVFAEAEAALVEAERQVALSETALIQTLQLDPRGSYAFQGPVLPDELPPPPDASLDEVLDEALAGRSDVRASETALEASGKEMTVARSGYWPSVSLSFNYGSNWSENSRQPVPGTGEDPRTVTLEPMGGGEPVTLEVPGSGSPPRFQPVDFFDQLDGRRGGSVSLSLSLPVFDGLQTRTQVDQARLARLNAQYDLQDQRQTVALQVRQAMLDYRSARARAEATSRRLEAAERGWEAAERRYELGAATFVEVSQARSTLVSARSAAIQARYDVFLARQRIEYHRGTLEPADALLLDSDPDADRD